MRNLQRVSQLPATAWEKAQAKKKPERVSQLPGNLLKRLHPKSLRQKLLKIPARATIIQTCEAEIILLNCKT